MDNIILDLLKRVDGKIDRLSQDVAIVKIKDAEQAAKLESLEEKLGYLSAKNAAIDERLIKFETECATKKDVDSLFEKVRVLEEAPQRKISAKIDFAKKAIMTGLAVLITGAVVSIGTVIWKLVINLDTVIEAIEKLKQGGGV